MQGKQFSYRYHIPLFLHILRKGWDIYVPALLSSLPLTSGFIRTCRSSENLNEQSLKLKFNKTISLKHYPFCMNVITWNCHMAFRKKYAPILSWKPDILVVPECENPEKINNKFYCQELWIGQNKHKSLGVFSFNNIDIKIHDSYCEDYKYVLPMTVTNPESLISMNFIAIWSQNNKEDPRRRYIGEVWNSLNFYKKLFHQPIIIAGDLNWNMIWDIKPEYPLYGKLTDVLNLLNEFGISSAYHHRKDMKFGCKQDPTFFLQYKRQKPYHTDYIFASADMMNKVKSVHIGEYDEWRPYSDHMPLMVELEGIQ